MKKIEEIKVNDKIIFKVLNKKHKGIVRDITEKGIYINIVGGGNVLLKEKKQFFWEITMDQVINIF